MSIHRISRFAVIALALLLAGPARAGVPFGDCSRPPFFAGGALTVIVLPYDADVSEKADPDARRVAEELPLLLQSAALRSVMKYRSIGSVGLVARPGQKDCTARDVLGKIEPQMRTGQALILVWGTLFEEDDELELQTYVRFMRKGMVEGLSFVVGSETFDAEVSDQTVVFGARRLSRQDLRDIQAAFENASLLRSERRAGAPGSRMYDLSDSRAFGYSVKDVQGDWLYVRSESGDSGWVNTATGFGGRTLAERMPEVDWIGGVAGYLRFRQGIEDGWPPPPEDVRAWVKEAFDSFYVHAGEDGTEQPLAVAEQLEGIVDYAWPKATPDDRKAAMAAFWRSSRRLPWSSSARTLAVFAELRSAFAADPSAWGPANHERELLQAVGLDPSNERLLRQVLSFYKLVDANRPARRATLTDIAPERVQKQMAQLKTIGFIAQPPPSPADSLLDLNSATSDELVTKLGLDSVQVRAVVYGRPFRGLDDPTLKKALGEAGIEKLSNKATVAPRSEKLRIDPRRGTPSPKAPARRPISKIRRAPG